MQKIKLGDYIDLLTDYHSGGSYKVLREKTKILQEPNYAVYVRTINFENDDFQTDLVYCDKESYDFLSYSHVAENDILMNKIANPGSVYIMPKVDFRATCGMNLFLIRLKNINQRYMFYMMKFHEAYIKGMAHGTTTKTITKDEVRGLIFNVHENIDDQNKVEHILSSLDDKIALNKKMNQKLEAMAKRLYDYWFVQFDFPDKNGRPYKTTGGPMTYNETLKREIPTGWEVKNVNDVTTSVRGVSYSSDDEKSKTDSNVVQILRGNNISGSRFVFDSNDVFVSSDLVAEEQKISKFDIVMTMSSGSKEHVGKSALALYDMPHSFGAFCSKFTPNEEAWYFIDCYLHSEIFIKYIRQTCSGTGINNLTNGHFDKSLFAWPTEDILKAFNEKVSAIYEQRGVIEREITRLTALRDKLLPLLMNGQVIVD